MSEPDRHRETAETQTDRERERLVTSEVKAFYEKIQFPGTRPMEQDSLIFFRKFSKLVTVPSGKRRTFRVLDAGCGTGNTSLALAAQFPHVEFTGVDLSGTSIGRARSAAADNGLANTRYYEWDLLQPFEHEQPFDIVLCFGALHHTARMQKALDTLSGVTDSDGTMFIWVYGEFGRYRHRLNMELLSMLLRVERCDDSVALTSEFIDSVGESIAAHDLLGPRSADSLLQGFFTNPTWIADQFLHPNEIVVNMRDILALLRGARLQIEEWIGAPKEVETIIRSPELLRRYGLLAADEQLIALDLLLKMDRYFLILSKSPEG